MVFLGKTVHSHIHMGTAGGNPAVDQNPIQGEQKYTRINAALMSQMVCKKTILNLTLHVTTEPTAGTTCFSSSLMTFIIDFYETKIKQNVCQI